MSKITETKENVLVLTEGVHFTLTALTNALNDKYGAKKSGVPFGLSDVKQYCSPKKDSTELKGIPSWYGGGYPINKIQNLDIGITVYEVVGWNK